jgi:hypothetical protein
VTFRPGVEVICCRDDGVVASAKESESRRTQTLRGGEVVSEND